MEYKERKYRDQVKAAELFKFEVISDETDLLILAEKNLYDKALLSVLKYRDELEKYIKKHKEFATTFKPYLVWLTAPQIVKKMAWAARRSKVGPMAAVAGAMSEFVGHDLLRFSREVIIENGGDIFIKSSKPRRVGIFAGRSPFSEKIAIEIDPADTPCGICTSSGTVGPSFSYGRADAVTVIAKSPTLADAAATSIGNVVKDVTRIGDGLKLAKRIRGLKGVLIIKGEQMGVMGKVKILPR